MKANEPMLTVQGLTLNFLEVIFNKDKLVLPKASYSDELYNEYKRNPDFFIYRFNNSLYLWKLYPTKEPFPDIFKEVEITIEEHAPIFTKIVESAIVELFRGSDYKVFKQRNSSIWEVELKYEEQGNFGALVVRPILAFSLRNLYSQTGRTDKLLL